MEGTHHGWDQALLYRTTHLFTCTIGRETYSDALQKPSEELCLLRQGLCQRRGKLDHVFHNAWRNKSYTEAALWNISTGPEREPVRAF